MSLVSFVREERLQKMQSSKDRKQLKWAKKCNEKAMSCTLKSTEKISGRDKSKAYLQRNQSITSVISGHLQKYMGT